MHYEGVKFNLRDARDSDAGELYNIMCDDRVTKYYGMGCFENIDEALNEIHRFKESETSMDGFRWVISDEMDRYIGDVGCYNYDLDFNCIEVSFKLKYEYWNQGILSEALQYAIDYAFNFKYYNRLQVKVCPENKGCIRLLDKTGFKYEGTLRQAEYEAGQYIDICIYSLLQTDIM